jgi:hypothetical protein
MKILIITAVALLIGCADKQERRFVCTEFTTPWSFKAYIHDDMIYWAENRSDKYIYYKIPPGHTCRFEVKE